MPVKKRRTMEEERALAKLRQARSAGSSDAGTVLAPRTGTGEVESAPPPAPAAEAPARDAKQSLLVKTAKLRETEPPETEAERLLKEEERLMQQLLTKKALMGVQELAKGVVYTQRVETGWRPPVHVRMRAPEHHNAIRRKLHILVEGRDVPPPIEDFRGMKLPPPVLRHLEGRGIKQPTPIQVQGIPVALSGRDMVGVAFTGSGKTLVFSLPLVMAALQEEIRMPLQDREGPVGFILAPSRELARQTAQIVEAMCKELAEGGYPR